MNYPLFLARRLSLGSGGHKSAPAVKVAVTAVALSVAVMMAAIAIVFGFKKEIRNKVAGFNSHITLYSMPLSEDDDNLVRLTPTMRQILDSVSFIDDYSLQVSAPAILKTPTDFKGVYLKSLGGDWLRSFVGSTLVAGEMPTYDDESDSEKILISEIASNQLNLNPGDYIDTYFITDDVRVRRLRVAGVFNSHFDNYDDIYVYGSLPLVQSVGGIKDNEGTSISVVTNDVTEVEDDAMNLRSMLTRALADNLIYKFYKVETLHDSGASYFRWLELLDMNVIVVLVLMTFVACITLVSGMLIIILDKKRFIGLLRSLGAPTGAVRRVFVYLAVKIAILGLVIGNGVSLLLLWLQRQFHFIPLDPDAYYIDFVPVDINWPSIILLNVATIAVIYCVLILPSWFVSRISPSETMRYE